MLTRRLQSDTDGSKQSCKNIGKQGGRLDNWTFASSGLTRRRALCSCTDIWQHCIVSLIQIQSNIHGNIVKYDYGYGDYGYFAVWQHSMVCMDNVKQ